MFSVAKFFFFCKVTNVVISFKLFEVCFEFHVVHIFEFFEVQICLIFFIL